VRMARKVADTKVRPSDRAPNVEKTLREKVSYVYQSVIVKGEKEPRVG